MYLKGDRENGLSARVNDRRIEHEMLKILVGTGRDGKNALDSFIYYFCSFLDSST